MTEIEFEELRLRHDPGGEAAINSVLSMPDDAGHGPRLQFLHEIDAVDGDAVRPLPTDLPPAVREFFEHVDLPAWLTQWGDVDAAHETAIDLFDEEVVLFVLALLCKALPECYAGAKGAAVLAYTGKLGDANYEDPRVQDTLVRRVVETAVFVRNVNTIENWKGATPRAIRTIRKVRLFHSGVRRMILSRPDPHTGQPWDINDMGYPINQQDTVGTLLAFCLLSMQGAEKMGASISRDQRNAMLLHWAVVGYHLGIEDEVLKSFLTDPEALWQRIKDTQFAPSPQGAALTGALASFMSTHLFIVQHRAHVPVLLMRYLLDKKAANAVNLNALGPAHTTWFYTLIGLILRIGHLLMFMLPVIGPWLIRRLGKDVMELTIEGWAGTRKPQITISDELEAA